ncbi:MAG: uracil-DNA glycosylase family protein [Planctomycetaceae bacterium]
MNANLIPNFLRQLKRVESTATVRNPYDSKDAVRNLRAYLNAICENSSGHLLIGEAPGYKGCALTGIPFTSPRVLRSGAHPFLDALRPSLSVTDDVAEATATMMWNALDRNGTVPAMWNAFPFHPHQPGNADSNRVPSWDEIRSCKRFIERIFDIAMPQTIVAVGNTSARTLEKLFPELEFESVRHPSFGGKADFIKGMNRLRIGSRS